jgi:hypothetical protein
MSKRLGEAAKRQGEVTKRLGETAKRLEKISLQQRVMIKHRRAMPM